MKKRREERMVPAVLRERMRAEGGRTHSYLSAARLTEELWLLSQMEQRARVAAGRSTHWLFPGHKLPAETIQSKIRHAFHSCVGVTKILWNAKETASVLPSCLHTWARAFLQWLCGRQNHNSRSHHFRYVNFIKGCLVVWQVTSDNDSFKTPSRLVSAFAGPLPSNKHLMRMDIAATSDLGDIHESELFDLALTPSSSLPSSPRSQDTPTKVRF